MKVAIFASSSVAVSAGKLFPNIDKFIDKLEKGLEKVETFVNDIQPKIDNF